MKRYVVKGNMPYIVWDRVNDRGVVYGMGLDYFYATREGAQRVADKLNEEDGGADYSYILWAKEATK